MTDPGRLTTAKSELSTAYNYVANPALIVNATIPTELGATTLGQGIYDSAAGDFQISSAIGSLTLDGGGNPNSVFIFKTTSTLKTIGAGSVVNLTNGAQACNIFWQVGSSATLGATSTFSGTIMAAVTITDAGGSTVAGRLLADANNLDADSTGAVTLNNTRVTVPTCAPSLQLLKTVTLDNGGTALNTAWTLTATGTVGSPTNLSGTTPVDSNVTYSNATFKADTYTLAESGGPSGYTASTYSCVKNGEGAVISNSITLAAGDDATCTITNNDQAPSFTLDKIVVNDNGGTTAESAWTLTATGPTTISGPGAALSTDVVSDGTFDAGTYTLSESAGPSGYTASSWSCVKNGGAPVTGASVSLGLGDTAICTITNNDIAPQLTVTKTVINDNGGTKVVSNFPLFLDGVGVTSGAANTTSAGLHTVSETSDSGYTATIGGDCAANGTITLALGDVKTCTIINDDIAPSSGGGSNNSKTLPLIGILKVPNPLSLPGGPGSATYDYMVWNVGGVRALTEVTVTDDKCGPVILLSGDLNNDLKLGLIERWKYSCTTTLSSTTTNTAIATGYSDDPYHQVTKASAIATVVVGTPIAPLVLTPDLANIMSVPGLPNTGFPPEEKSTPWSVIILSGIFAVSVLLLCSKKQTT